MQIGTTRFGNIEITDESVIHIPQGMLGLQAFKRFVLLEDRHDTGLKWLQSVDNPALAFMVTEPKQHFVDYDIELSGEQSASLDLADPRDAAILTTVTVENSGRVTTNLLGPIVINTRTMQAAQVLVQDERYGTKHTICDLPGAESQPEQAKAA